MPPIDTTTGLPAARAAASSARITSDAVTLPPWAINTQDNRFHFRVKASVADLCRSGITANIPLSFLAIHNCAISKDDTDAVTGICRRFQCVIVITDGAIIFYQSYSSRILWSVLFRFPHSMPVHRPACFPVHISRYRHRFWLNPQATLARPGEYLLSRDLAG